MLSAAYRHWIGSFQGLSREIWILSLVALINRIGAMIIPFLSVYLTSKLGFTYEDSGYILSFFGVGALIGAYFGGKMTDSMGYYKVQVVSLVLNGLMFLAMPLLHTFTEMSVAVLLMSFTSEIFRPANSVAFLRNSTAENRTRAIGLYRLALNLGFSVAPALGGLLLLLDWNYIFWVDSITCIFAGIILMLTMREKPKTAQEETPAPKNSTNTSDSAYKNKPYLYFILFTFLNAIVFLQFVWTLPIYYKDVYHWDESKIGLFLSINGLIIVLVELPIISKLEKMYDSLKLMRIGLILYALSYLIYLLPLPAAMAVIGSMIFISFGEMGIMPFSSSLVMTKFGANRQGQYMALYTMSYSVANIVAPSLGAKIASLWGFNTLWCVLGSLVIAAYAVLSIFERESAVLKSKHE